MTTQTLYRTLASHSVAAALTFGAVQVESAGSLGFSDEAREDEVFIVEAGANTGTYAYSMTGAGRLINQLAALLERGTADDWDEGEHDPMSSVSFRAAFNFALKFEPDIRDAEVDVDPEGEVCFDWYEDCDNQCTITFSRLDDRIHCMKLVKGKSASMISTDFNEIRGFLGNVITV